MPMRETIFKAVDDWVGSDPDNAGVILEALADAMRATGEHLVSTWQDRGSSAAWERIARAVDRACKTFLDGKPY